MDELRGVSRRYSSQNPGDQMSWMSGDLGSSASAPCSPRLGYGRSELGGSSGPSSFLEQEYLRRARTGLPARSSQANDLDPTYANLQGLQYQKPGYGEQLLRESNGTGASQGGYGGGGGGYQRANTTSGSSYDSGPASWGTYDSGYPSGGGMSRQQKLQEERELLERQQYAQLNTSARHYQEQKADSGGSYSSANDEQSWQDRCLALQMELNRSRTQAASLRNMLKDQVGALVWDLYQSV